MSPIWLIVLILLILAVAGGFVIELGGVHAGVQKWKHKADEAKAQESFPVKV